MSSKIPNEAQEAKVALIFLNAAILAELDNNFKHLKKLGVEASIEFKRSIYSANNSSQRDFVSNNQGAQDELSDLNVQSYSTIGDLVDARKEEKKRLHKSGKSSQQEKVIEKPQESQETQPIKVYSAEELEKFSAEYFSSKITKKN